MTTPKLSESPQARRPRQYDAEMSEQIALFQWLRPFESRYPLLKTIHSIPNGSKRSPAEAGKLKASGQLSGVWDIHVPVVKYYHGGSAVAGLRIEMKAPALRRLGDRALSPEQVAFREALRDDCAWFVAFDWLEAAAAILHYLDLDTKADLLYSLPARKEPIK